MKMARGRRRGHDWRTEHNDEEKGKYMRFLLSESVASRWKAISIFDPFEPEKKRTVSWR